MGVNIVLAKKCEKEKKTAPSGVEKYCVVFSPSSDRLNPPDKTGVGGNHVDEFDFECDLLSVRANKSEFGNTG